MQPGPNLATCCFSIVELKVAKVATCCQLLPWCKAAFSFEYKINFPNSAE
jgi:hypothetical protein